MATAADIREAITAAAADADAGNVTREDYLRYAAGQLSELAGTPLDRAIAPNVREDLHAAATAAYREGYLSYADYYTVDVWLAHSRRGRRTGPVTAPLKLNSAAARKSQALSRTGPPDSPAALSPVVPRASLRRLSRLPGFPACSGMRDEWLLTRAPPRPGTHDVPAWFGRLPHAAAAADQIRSNSRPSGNCLIMCYYRM